MSDSTPNLPLNLPFNSETDLTRDSGDFPLLEGCTRRTFLAAGSVLLLSVILKMPAQAAQILRVRVWPAEDYTRITLENDTSLKATHFMIKNPDRLVVDIEGIELNAALKGLVAKIQSNDPYIERVRVGQNRPHIVRLVFDLKEEIQPQVFSLAPIGSYNHRLIFDLYPVNPPDPLAALIKKGEWAQEPAAATHPAGTTEPSLVDNFPAESEKTGSAFNEEKDKEKNQEQAKEKAKQPARESAKNQKEEKRRITRLLTIALDPGHGGEDPGAIGPAGSREKDVVLAIAKRLKAKIEEQPNMRAMLTRDADYFVPLHVRVQKARKVQADLFVSIHADAFVESSARGSSVFILSLKGASSTAARWLARKENAADLIGGINLKNQDPELASVLLDLSTTAQINDSTKVGNAVLRAIGNLNRLHKGSVEQASFAVLKAPDIPSILIETAFISNPEEEVRLNDSGYQDQMATAILNGIRQYFAKNPPLAKTGLP